MNPNDATTTPTAPPTDANRVRIFDTTLRDGEQSPGASMNLTEKIEVARALPRLGIDVIEAGFPIASQGDFEAVRAIAMEVTGSIGLRPGAVQRARHRPRLGSRPPRSTSADPCLSRHLAPSIANTS